MKWFRKPSKKAEIIEEYERCAICGELTNVRRETPIDQRDFYVVGCGQLCFDCHRRTGTEPELQISNENMAYLLKCCRKDTKS